MSFKQGRYITLSYSNDLLPDDYKENFKSALGSKIDSFLEVRHKIIDDKTYFFLKNPCGTKFIDFQKLKIGDCIPIYVKNPFPGDKKIGQKTERIWKNTCHNVLETFKTREKNRNNRYLNLKRKRKPNLEVIESDEDSSKGKNVSNILSLNSERVQFQQVSNEVKENIEPSKENNDFKFISECRHTLTDEVQKMQLEWKSFMEFFEKAKLEKTELLNEMVDLKMKKAIINEEIRLSRVQLDFINDHLKRKIASIVKSVKRFKASAKIKTRIKTKLANKI